jgi:hypothetical protein
MGGEEPLLAARAADHRALEVDPVDDRDAVGATDARASDIG